MSTSRCWSTAFRLLGAAGVLTAASAAWAQVTKPGAPQPRPAASAGSEADAAGPELTKEMSALKDALAARDNVPTGLRGPGPANDLCTGAIDLATLGFAAGANITVNDNNTNATADAEPACGFTNTSQTSGSLGLWYRFTGTGNYVEFSTCQQATDMTIRAFCGTDCFTRTCIGADDDGCVTNSLGSRLGICTSAGQTYWVLVARYGTVTAGAAFSFTVTDNNAPCGTPACGVPANDTCAAAETVAIGASVRGNTANATSDSGEQSACAASFTGQQGVWFKVTGNGTILRATSCNATTGAQTVISVFSGVCGGLTCVASNATTAGCGLSPRDDTAVVDWNAASATDYYILVSNDTNGAGEFLLSVTSIGLPAANDTCASATPVLVPSSGNYNNIGSSPDTVPCGGTNSTGVWFSFTGNGRILSVSTCGAGTSFNTKLGIYTNCAALTCVDFNATAAPACSPTTAATVTFCSANGVTYYALVSGDTTGTGTFDLSITDLGACPTNDLCSTATPVALPSSTAGSNVGATNDNGLPTCSTLLTWNNGVWFRFTGNGNRVAASTCDPATTLNTRVYVFTSPDCVNFTCVGANATASPACAAPANAATVSFCSTQGQDYYVLVTNDTSGTGAFQLVISDLGPVGCVPTGACCAGGSCTITTQAACTGNYLGNNTSCSPSISPALAIPENTPAGVDSSIVVPSGAPTITDLDVALIIQHTFQGDIRVTLTHVDTNTTVTLIDRPGVPATTVGFANDNYGDPTTSTPFVLDDEAADVYDAPAVVAPGITNVTGSWKPDLGPLSAFDGQSLSGTWTLNVSDNAGLDTGSLVFWSLGSTPAYTPCPTGPDCFTRGTVAAASGCSPTYTANSYNRPTNAGHFAVGGGNGAADTAECISDWDGNGCILPSDVASFVTSAFYDFSNPGSADAQIDCGAGPTVPATVAAFVTRWFNALSNPAGDGCTP